MEMFAATNEAGILLQKLIGAGLKFLEFYVIGRFIVVFTTVCHLPLF